MPSVAQAIRNNTNFFVDQTKSLLQAGHIFGAANPFRLWAYVWNISYILAQAIIIWVFKPTPPYASKTLANPHGKIAVIGAGITGVSSAAHAISHGFEVVIFEAAPKSKLGGIWANVNKTSSLQLNSLLYRFHPAVLWSKGFPYRDEILGEVETIWKEYHLDTRTRFETKVTSVRRAPHPKDKSEWANDPDRSRWVINNNQDEIFDAVIVTIGTCGDPNWVKLPGMPEDVGQEQRRKKKRVKVEQSSSPTQDTSSPHPSAPPSPVLESKQSEGENNENTDKFEKLIIHSSQLDSPKFKLKSGQKIVIIGSGASGVEAVETVLQKYDEANGGDKSRDKKGINVYMVARDDKWIIPRNIVVDTLISAQPFGREMPLSFLWEAFLRRWQYKGVEQLVPDGKGIYEGTPVVNDIFLSHVRNGRCTYVRGQPIRLSKDGVIVTGRKSKVDKKSRRKEGGAVDEVQEGEEKLYNADVIIFATGYKKPSLDFLPEDLFPEGYQRPDLYLQNFSTEDWSILMTNSAYMNAIGTVGHFHIGIYTRILLTLLLDKSARPSSKDMKLWVDVLRFIKRGATGGALGFFTYMELTIWLLGFHLLRPDRLRWMFFIMNGWGVHAQE